MIVLRIVVCGLLFSNLRATWIAPNWEPTSETAALPPRLGETLGDKLADLWPAWIWLAYYIFSLVILLFFALGIAALSLRSAHQV
jgi:hypothetical protein